MKEIDFNELLEMAKNFHRNSIKWHFHVLMKKCIFNKNKRKFSIILENEDKKDVFVTYFDEDPKKYAEKLENLFYRGIY